MINYCGYYRKVASACRFVVPWLHVVQRPRIRRASTHTAAPPMDRVERRDGLECSTPPAQ